MHDMIIAMFMSCIVKAFSSFIISNLILIVTILMVKTFCLCLFEQAGIQISLHVCVLFKTADHDVWFYDFWEQ